MLYCTLLGLNKMNKSKLYDLIYAKADRLFREYNPCDIHICNNTVICNNTKSYLIYGGVNGNQTMCCPDSCKHLSFSGCTIKNASCKAFKCGFIIHHYPVLSKKLYRLERILSRYNLNGYFMTKNKILKLKR